MSHKIFPRAFKETIPVLLGYLAIGTAFGMLIVQHGYPWYLSIFMSVVIYAGAGQYIALGLFAAGSSLPQILIITFLVNCRHMIYGLSLLEKFKDTPKLIKLYLIFSLTDETYALLTSTSYNQKDKHKFYFLISLFNQFYWILGSLVGAIAGSLIPINFDGIDFSLTALFAVLLVEQFRSCDSKMPFIFGGIAGILAIIIDKDNMLIISISIYIFSIFLSKNKFLPKEETQC